jgi:hypothetical protein|tara:strand:+ start:9168 stop:9626 length:459 start_codon:yes stop_codon:yes gene_type:complete
MLNQYLCNLISGVRVGRNMNSTEEAKAAFRRWLDGFNSRDSQAMIAEMHFPHLRLARTKFDSWDTPADWLTGHNALTEKLLAEDWDHTDLISMEAVQASDEKVHLVMRQSRRKKDGTEYSGFDTLWVFTKDGGRWGAKLRSSFLTANAQLYS